MAVKELETVLSDEPGLLGPKARERNGGGGTMANDKSSMWGECLAIPEFLHF